MNEPNHIDPSGLQLHHKDGDTSNNSLENLKVVMSRPSSFKEATQYEKDFEEFMRELRNKYGNTPNT